MGKKIIWLLVSCMMALSLIVASCGSEEEEGNGEEIIPGEEVVGTTEPRYGSTLTIAQQSDWSRWDPAYTQAIMVGHMQYSSNELMQGDWTKGPKSLGGTGETAWEIGFLGLYDLLTGELAESWSMPTPTTIRFVIRDDIYFQDIPPASGRKMTAEDVAWNIEMQFTWEGTWQNITYPPDSGLAPTKYEVIDDQTVEITVPAEAQEILLLEIGENQYVNPPEIWIGTGSGEGEKMGDWTKICGSGPWIVDDYVADSRILLRKFDNYFEEDPLNPGNRLPYLDNLEILTIPDLSTILASVRTGKIDLHRALSWDDLGPIVNAKPDLEYVSFTGAPNMAAGRQDQEPFDDIRVRQAMNMAINKQDMLENYFKGRGALFPYPFPPTPGYAAYYEPLENMPEEVRMLWDYDVDEAKQLLADAGYPDGFETEIICMTTQVDDVSVLKAYLADIGIDMEIKPLEMGNYFSVRGQKSWDGMFYGMGGYWAPFEMLNTKVGQTLNFGIINDPYYDDVQLGIAQNIISDPDKYIQTVKDAAVYELASAWAIFQPARSTHHCWWPWVKNYEGINWTGWAGINDWFKMLWIDEDLKAEMGY